MRTINHPPEPAGPASDLRSNQPPAGPPSSLVILLSVAAYAGIGLMLTGCEPKKTTPAPEPVATQSVTTVALPVSNPPPASVTAITNSAPTNPPPKIRLQGIVYDPVRPGAIVNGQTVYVGSRVGELRVIVILKDTVTLEAADGTQQKLVLGK
jgi:hypothetical protein